MLTAAALPEERSSAIWKLTRDWRLIAGKLRQAQDPASFVTRPNIATLGTWAALPNISVRGYFALEGTDLQIGPDARETTAVSVLDVLLTEVPAIPPFGERIEAV
ncbi:hypothetical protein [Methylorubrum salsuginis]|uniref:Uncharacterized protein n=1 Tax=Methylorubrum salsuginis TaxID=414703 RepID=A0A1I4FMA9_9HYPH|nr:hypothetical protein [Methylorubrum salsuginis]SFL19032.1 hypothetical protein SAMN04488125_110119 [Methylorubrum salsuginis]